MKPGNRSIRVRVRQKPADTIHRAILDPLIAFNTRRVGKVQPPRAFAVTIENAKSGKVIGGLWGLVWARWLYIDQLFVPEMMRGTGLGSDLMRLAEAEALRRGCVGAWVDTFDFQAKPFYVKLGYREFGSIPDFLENHTRHFLCKRFKRGSRK